MARDGEDFRDPPLEGSAADGRELIYWIAHEARRLRKDAGVSKETIASLAGVGVPTVDRFEKLTRFPKKLDAIMCAVAIAAGLDDEREIYDGALELWRRKGSSVLARSSRGATHAERFERALVEGAQRSRPAAPGGSAGKSSSTRKRRAAP